MVETQPISENRLLTLFRTLPEQKQVEVLDFILFIIHQIGKQEKQSDKTKAMAAVEETWGTLAIDRETLMYIAEDKELEYDV